MASSEELSQAFLEKHYPWILKARAEVHEFEPMPMSDAEMERGHECDGRCVCNRCWKNKSDRAVHFQRRKKRS